MSAVVDVIAFKVLVDHHVEALHPGDVVRCGCQLTFPLSSFAEHLVCVTAEVAAAHIGGSR